ncbi:exonuclease mut-7 homolog [Melitaea cinxia]|uniref:exonuclease mut-7 homolog n=1 Tax=Melitaea cinxia TaxID=113334 RepID=UPI001E270396|nr:exonuclease mut-7 homolog [Melitaea cinxia]
MIYVKMDINKLVDKDQPIKIVPSLEETLNVLGLNTSINDNIIVWFNQLKLKWKTWKISPTTDHHFQQLFQLTSDPYRDILVCIIRCEESKDCKPKTLPYYMLECLHKWSESSDILPEETLKLPAFQIAIQQRNSQFLVLLLKTYKINTIKKTIVPIVKDMLRNDNCKKASQIVITLELFDEIPVENLLFPLILQDRSTIIDEYLLECPDQVKPLILFLDNLLDNKINLKDFTCRYIDENKVCNVKYEKIHHKPLGKLVARLCNKFNIPIETCKNLSKNRTRGGLRYLIYQKYVEHNVSASVWDDLVKDSLRNNIECVNEFIDMLVDYDTKEALKWATYFNVPKNSLPLAITNLSIEEVPVDVENWDDTTNYNQKYYKLTISEKNIKFIDTGEKFYDLVSNLVNCNVVSIDCEWKPSFGATQSQVALIQLASYNCVYLIDTLILNNKQYSSFWYRFNKSLLDNAEIIKLGFGLEQDLKEIKSSITSLSNIKVKGEGLLDLGLLWKSLINIGLSLPSDSDSGGNSLSSLVQACFGLPLEKAEQCSNWELRPLRSTQIDYAALDAFVLLEIYYHLQKLCAEQQINFDEVCNDVMLEKKLKSAKKITVADRLQAYTMDFKSKQVNEVKIVVEHDLSYLLAYFRYCGIDTIVVSPTNLWHDTVNLALLEDRYILTAKLKCSPTPRFSQHLILDVSQGSVKDQVLKALSTYNVVVTQSDLLSRCLQCNDIDLRKLTIDEVNDICTKYQMPCKSSTNCRRYASDEEEDPYYDNFLSDSDGDDLYLCPSVTKQKNLCATTNKGALIDISNFEKLLTSPKPAVLCEKCGKLYWDEDPLIMSVCEIISSIIKISN